MGDTELLRQLVGGYDGLFVVTNVGDGDGFGVTATGVHCTRRMLAIDATDVRGFGWPGVIAR